MYGRGRLLEARHTAAFQAKARDGDLRQQLPSLWHGRLPWPGGLT